MNSNVLPQGPQETITDGTVQRNVLALFAETDLVIAAITYEFPATPANTAAVTAFTLPKGRFLAYVDSVTFTGTATVIYKS